VTEVPPGITPSRPDEQLDSRLIDQEIDPDDLAAGYVPPDPDEPPPVELWTALPGIQPWATLLLLLSWALVFATMAARGEIDDVWSMFAWGASATGLAPIDTAWRLLASTFLHAGIAHLFFNAMSMLIFGPAVERIFTRWGFLTVFAIGGAGASLASLMWRTARHESGLSISVGASGAIFALGGALLAAAFRLRHRLAPGRARALGGAILFLVAQGLANGLTKNSTDNIAHAAGLLVGMVVGIATPLDSRLEPGRSRILVRIIGVVALLALATSLGNAVRSGWSS
jgi:rhomboid protease GluP